MRFSNRTLCVLSEVIFSQKVDVLIKVLAGMFLFYNFSTKRFSTTRSSERELTVPVKSVGLAHTDGHFV